VRHRRRTPPQLIDRQRQHHLPAHLRHLRNQAPSDYPVSVKDFHHVPAFDSFHARSVVRLFTPDRQGANIVRDNLVRKHAVNCHA
jgi:hypothetical protein